MKEIKKSAYFFADETGSASLKDSHNDYFGFGFLGLNSHKLDITKPYKELFEFVDNAYKYKTVLTKKKYFHATDDSDKTRSYFFKKIRLKRSKFNFMYFYINKNDIIKKIDKQKLPKNESDLYIIFMKVIFLTICKNIGELADNSNFVFTMANIYNKTKQSLIMESMIKNADLTFEEKMICKNVSSFVIFKDHNECSILQISDYLSWFCQKKVKGNLKPYESKYFDCREINTILDLTNEVISLIKNGIKKIPS